MTSPDADLADAICRERERAIRQAMAICNNLKYQRAWGNVGELCFRMGHDHCRLQLFHELERMIAREAPAANAPATRDDDGGC